MLSNLLTLQPEWEALWNRSPRATPFQSPAWLIPWTKHLFGGGEILTLTEYDANRLIGFIPLFRWGGEVTTTSFLGAGVSDYGDVLGSFRKVTLPSDTVLEEIPPSSPLLQLPGIKSEPCSVCPVLEIAEYPAALNPKLKVDLRRARNKLEKNHRIQFSVATAETLPTALDGFFRLHAARWHSEGQTGVLVEAALQNFHREVAAGFSERGLLRLYTLHIDGAAASAIYAIRAHETLYCYLSGFDPQFSKLSPGGVLLQHAVESAIAEGVAAVDFLRQPEPYKYLWGARDRINSRLRVRPS